MSMTKAVSQNQAGWKCYKKSPTLHPPFFFFLSSAGHDMHLQIVQVSLKMVYMVQRALQRGTQEQMEGAQTGLASSGYFLFFSSFLRRHLELRLLQWRSAERARRLGANNRRRWNGEGELYWQKCSLHFVRVSSFGQWAENGVREADNYWYLLAAIREGERGREAEREAEGEAPLPHC